MKISDLKYLILFVILFSIAVFLQRKFLQPEDYQIDTTEIEKSLHILENKTDTYISELENEIQKVKVVTADSTTTWLIDKDFTSAQQNGLLFFIYKNDSLRYWSGNTLTVSTSLSETVFGKNSIAELPGGWYEIRTKKVKNNISIIGLIKLRNNFSYQNKYLENAFHPALGMPSIVQLSPVPLAHGQNINSVSGKYAFSIVPVSKVISKTDRSGIIGLFYFLSFGFLLLYINTLFVKSDFKRYNSWYLFLAFIAMFGVRFLMIKYKFPIFLYSLRFFDPEVAAGGNLFSYLGDYLLNAMLLVFFSSNFFRIFNVQKKIISLSKKIKSVKILVSIFCFSILWISFSAITILISQLIQNSDIPLIISDITQISIFSFTVYVVIGLLLLSFFVLAHTFFNLLVKFLNFKTLIITLLITTFSCFLVSTLSPYFTGVYTNLFFIISCIAIAMQRFFTPSFQYFSVVILIFIASLFTTIFVSSLITNKQNDVQKILVTQLTDQRDDIAEHLIREVEKRLSKDEFFTQYLLATSLNQEAIMTQYLTEKYFNGYWKKYDLKLFICGQTDYFRDENKTTNCDAAYNKQINKLGTKVKGSNFFFLNNRNGTITYTRKFSVTEDIDPRHITLYISLNSKLISKELGYPELLLDEKSLKPDIFADYSFANYQNGELVKKSGKYPYNLNDEVFASSKRYSVLKQNNYIHEIYRPEAQTCMVLSRKAPHPLNLLISFSYLFVFFNIIVFVSTLIVKTQTITQNFKPDFKNKIRFSMLIILLLTFFLFAAVTIYYTLQQHNEIQQKEMTDKIQSVLTEMEHKLLNEKKLDKTWHTNNYKNLDELLVKFSQVFYTDINLYDLNGRLLATSRYEIFKRGLISKFMNSKAYNELYLRKKTKFIQTEKIGDLSYASVYIPFRNGQNEVTAYINLPYFTNPEALRKEISSILVTVINIYVVLLLITVLAAFIISTKIIKPLLMLKNKFKNLELGKKHKPINYQRDDEIGGLVREYNRMVEELAENMKKLAESERESAWREMAKQIAHEIKNPLTPMKLSIQLLERAWNDKKPDFDKRITKVTHTVMEQIDTLSAIASEFSAFAKMPKAQDEAVDIVEKLQTIVQLFEHTRNTKVTFNFNNNTSVFIVADKEQISRVFINLIKNGIQSVPDGIMGQIHVELITYANKIKVTIKDNGHGIPEDRRNKLFKPSFTTKTTGMGMGLAIVKNIIKNANGEIWFESEVGKGTEFFVEFPIME